MSNPKAGGSGGRGHWAGAPRSLIDLAPPVEEL